MRIEVRRGGLLTTIQDLGRPGHAALGVGRGGVADAYSARVANLLVGNRIEAALLEVTLSGPALHFPAAARIALCGADIEATANDEALPGWRPVELAPGSVLSLGRCRRGARAYLAIAGGVVVPRVLGSAATDLRGGLGGLAGRALREGDVLESGMPSRRVTARDTPSIASWSINPSPDIDFHASTVAGVLPGADACTPGDILGSHAWQVDAGSDRQGLRLKGPDIALSAPCTRPSEPVLPGTIQCPPDGQPIILLADAQTVGGYPRIGHVAQADLPRLAQLRPGETLCFHDIDVEEAIALHRAQQARLARIELAIQARLAR